MVDTVLLDVDGTLVDSNYLHSIAWARAARRLEVPPQPLVERGRTVVMASSGRAVETEHYLRLLDIGDLVRGWTSSSDVATTKPTPDLVQAALRLASAAPERAVRVGDSPYDVQAARAAGVGAVGVLTGGFSAAELAGAGAGSTWAAVGELFERLDEVLGQLDGEP